MSGWNVIRASALDHPNVVEGREVIPGGPSQAWIEDVRREYGESSPYYVARVLAEFPETAVDSLVRREWLDRALRKHRDADLDFWAEGDVVVGVDPARKGPDATAVCVRQGQVVREIRVWKGQHTTTDTVDKIRKLLAEITGRDKPRVRRVVVDEIGVGGGVVDSLEAALAGQKFRHAPISRGRHRPPTVRSTIEVRGFNSSRSAADTERFLNLRAAAYWQVRDALERGELFLPDDADLIEELAAIRWQVTGSGAVQLEAKSDLRARLGRSPDKADALSMSYGREAMPRQSRIWFR